MFLATEGPSLKFHPAEEGVKEGTPSSGNSINKGAGVRKFMVNWEEFSKWTLQQRVSEGMVWKMRPERWFGN